MERHISITQASIGNNEQADADGAYDLHDVEGTPEEVAKAILDSLKACDLLRGGNWSYLENGQPVYLNITIKVTPK